MSYKSWGNYPKKKVKGTLYNKETKLKKGAPIIAYGNGRSYGDSALSNTVIDFRSFNYYISFDQEKGILECQSGVLLSDIIETFLPKGWFLKITPGTKWISIGGAIAADVHGKNHHVEGSFQNCVISFKLKINNDTILLCSREHNSDLFYATFGGMGLTGLILEATISLKKVKSAFINQTIVKTKSLFDTFNAFEKYKEMPYSVAWIDCLAKKNKMGRSLLMLGDFASDNNFQYSNKQRFNMPLFLPSFTLNPFTVKLFNFIYYNKVRKRITNNYTNFENFFYPLDSIKNWNRMYGRRGFTQYQFVLPINKSFDGLSEILETISKSHLGSFLAVLKLFGKGNPEYLSFPIEGYTLALDFKIEEKLFPLLNKLDTLVNKYSGKVYLAKDCRISQGNFQKGYKNLTKFRALREKYSLNEMFQSYQSERLNT